jgi:hypothetical protein
VEDPFVNIQKDVRNQLPIIIDCLGDANWISTNFLHNIPTILLKKNEDQP